MFFTNLQEYSMHKSVIVLSILFFGFDLGAVKHAQSSEARRLAALGIDYEGVSFAKKKRESFDSSGSVAELALLKRCKQLKRENDALRSKLAVSPEELSRGGESSSNPDRLSLDSGSRGTSPVIGNNSISHATSPLAIVRVNSKEKAEASCEPTTASYFPICESPCGFWMPSSEMSSSFPSYNHFSSLRHKNVSPLIPPLPDCP